jgi:homoserine dehydrogenase
MKLLLIGFGVVGQGLARILRDQADDLKARYGFVGQIVGVATRTRGTLYHADGLDVDALLAAIAQGHLDRYPEQPGLVRNVPTLDLIRDYGADALVEASYSNLDTGQPALDYCHAALDSGQHVVMANKGPVALAYAELAEHARRVGRQIGFEATVMAGTPALRLGHSALAGCHITAARGILNGTTNYILTQMENGLAYDAALAQAQELGYAEADPTADVEGWDAAGKVLILAAALFGQRLTFDDLTVTGISGLTPADIEAARAAGERWKLIASVTADGGRVEPVRLPISNPLANIAGATNAITYTTDLLGDVTLVGPGAGQSATAFGLLADLLAIHV